MNKAAVYFLVVLLLAAIQNLSFAQDVRFNSISLASGLSQSTVTCITQDNEGFIWIGTRDGLNRYDGYNFTILRESDENKSSLSSSSITAIFQDSQNRIWVGTAYGLNVLDGITLRTTSYLRQLEDSTSLSSNSIRCISEDGSGNIWVGTDFGLNRFVEEKEQFVRYSIAPDDSTSLLSSVVNDIELDRTGGLWIATDGGVNLYNADSDNFKRMVGAYSDGRSLDNNRITEIEKGPGDTLWLGTHDGLSFINTSKQTIKRAPRTKGAISLEGVLINTLLYDAKGELWVATPLGLHRLHGSKLTNARVYHSSPNDFYTLPNDFVLSLFQDKSGMMWIGTQSAGIATLNEEMPKFSAITSAGTPQYDPLKNQIYDLCQINPTEIWMGTGKGVAIYNPLSKEVDYLLEEDAHPLTDLEFPVRGFARAGDSLVYVATDGGGLVIYDIENEVYARVGVEQEIKIPTNRISDVVPDAYGNVWLATYGQGVICFNTQGDSIQVFGVDLKNPSSLRDLNVQVLQLQGDTVLWIGTSNAGMNAIDVRRKEFISCDEPKKENSPAASGKVNDIFLDSNNKMWVAFSGEGLSYFDQETKKYHAFDSEQGLDSDEVLSILADDYGNIWMSTNRGISVYNLSSGQFRNYSEQDVLTRNTFFSKSSHQDDSSMLYFGGSNGFGFFNALGLRANKYVPPIVITAIQSLSESDPDSPFDKAQNRKDTLLLAHNHDGFTLEFASLNYKQSTKNQYAYRLNGMFNNWKYTGTRRFATFLNLDPGKYVFEVIGSNNDGLWNETPATLVILVQPALWQETWFQALMVMALVTLLFLFYRYKISSEQLRNKELETAVATRTEEIAKERDTNAILLREVHHRVKNNLQVIVSLLNLQKRFIENKQFGDVFSEVQDRVRSMSLIHQKMYQTDDLQSVDLEEYITDLSNSLLSTYRVEQEIQMEIDVSVNTFNADTLTPLGLLINEIITNSLKYAFKFDQKGKLFVKLHKLPNSKKYRLIIGDDGIGIASDKFDDPSDSFGTELISALVEQLNGSMILLKDEPGTVYQIDFEEELS